ncbi:MAG: hypothetical protein H6818_05030 [Phycisphaerales bacterium]|nr:hypothetical protein [Phycisphaerales bacterium]MCB9863452.1 hypothetical protein [Phycisphaerales bacterium]
MRNHVTGFCLFTIVALSTAIAQADIPVAPNLFIWNEAVPLNADSSVILQGQSGGDTTLGCDTSNGPTTCVWHITTMLDSSLLNGSADEVMASYGVDLLGDTSRHSIPSGSVGPAGYPYDGWTVSNAGGTGGVLTGFKGVLVPVGPASPPAPGVHAIMEYTLTSTLNSSDTNLDGIDVAVNDLLIALVSNPGPSGPALIQFGDAPTISGSNESEFAADVINFQIVPEPTSCMLLVFIGAIAANTRTRRRSA